VLIQEEHHGFTEVAIERLPYVELEAGEFVLLSALSVVWNVIRQGVTSR
jgi:hypothetical protein